MADESLRSRYRLFANLLRQGLSGWDIARMLNTTVQDLEEVFDDPEFQELLESLEVVNGVGAGSMTPEEVLERAESLTPIAFTSLEKVLNNPQANDNLKMRAAEWVLARRSELQESKKDQRVTHYFVLDKDILGRMEQIFDVLGSRDGQDWIRRMSSVMPPSTA